MVRSQQGKGRSLLFVNKKKQKNFENLGWDSNVEYIHWQKFFGSFFQKRTLSSC